MRLLLSVTTQQLIIYSMNNSNSGSKSTGDSEAALQGTQASTGSACPALRCRACPHTLLCADAPYLARLEFREPEVAIRPGCDAGRPARRRKGELGDNARFGPGGSNAQAQQADAGNQGDDECSHV